MADAPEVKIKITAEDQGVAAAIKNLTSQLQSIKDKEAEVADSTLDLTSAFAGLIQVLAVEKILEFGKEVFNAGVSIARLAQVTGISSETLSVYTQAAKDAGGGVDEMQGGLKKLAVVLLQADQGSARAAKSLALAGLSTKDFVGLNADQKLRKVTDAIGAMPPGFQKVAAAQKLLGNSSETLLLALTALAGDGFEKAREEAEKFGNILSTQGAQDLLVAQAALKDLEAEAEGAARQFETGFVPSLTDAANAILAATSGGGVDGFKSMGEVAGEAFKYIVGGFLSIGVSAGTAAAEIEEFLDYAFNHTKEAAKSAFAAVRGYITGGIGGGAAAAAEQIATSGDKATQDFAARIVAMEKTAAEQQQKVADEIFNGTSRKNQPPPKPPGKDPAIGNVENDKAAIKAQQLQDQTYQAQLAAAVKELQAETEINKAKNEAQAARDKAQFDEGLITLDEYFARRRALIQSDNDVTLKDLAAQKEKETEASQRAGDEAHANLGKSQKAGPSTPAGQEFSAAAARNLQEQQRAEAALAEVKTKTALEEETTQKKLNDEDLVAFKAKEEQTTKLATFQKEIYDIQGNTTAAAKAEAAAKEQEYRTLLLSQKGATASSVAAQIAQYHDLTEAVAQYNDAKKAGETAIKSLDDQEAAIQLRVQTGQIFQIQADQQIRDLKTQQLSQLQAIAAAQLAAAQKTGNQADIQSALDFSKDVAQISVQANQAEQNLAKIKEGLQGTIESSFANFFDTGILKARNLGQAFAGLADSITSGLRKIVAGMLAQMATQKLLQALPKLASATDGPQKIASAAAAGTAQAAPLTAAATALTTAGTLLTTAGTALGADTLALGTAGATILSGATALGVSAAALDVAANTLLLANEIGSSSGMARGGLVQGPGSGTSDSISAKLSHGEFVMRASAVRAIGASTLYAMNRGLSIGVTAPSAPAPAHFAEGGLVGGTGGNSSPALVHMQIGMEEGIVLKHMKSAAAGKVVISHIANNPKSASKAIGRSS
jgi:hypothetical protein